MYGPGCRSWLLSVCNFSCQLILLNLMDNILLFLKSTALSVASPAMGHWGTRLFDFLPFSFLVHFGVNLTANYPSIV